MIEYNNHEYLSEEWLHEESNESKPVATTKCGEIFCDDLGSVWLTCGYCNFTEFDTLANYILHISIHFAASSKIKQEIVYPASNNDDYYDNVATHSSSPQPPPPPSHLPVQTSDPFDQIVNQPTSVMIKSEPYHQNKLINVKRETHLTRTCIFDLPKFSRKKISLSCDYCNKVVAQNRPELIKHMWKIHRYGYPCPVCNHKFQHLYKVENHLKIHKKETTRSDIVEEWAAAYGRSVKSESSSSTMKLGCDYCQANVANSRSDLILHMWRVHRIGFGCPICNFQCQYPYKLKTHLLSHSGYRPYECSVCGLCYSGKATLKQHMKKHAPTKEYLCPICGKAFYGSNQFNQHRAVHEKKQSPPVKCTQCLRTYRSLGMLKRHITHMHLSLQYVCDICSAVMKNRRRLNDHMNMHAGRRPYKCRYCGEGFLNMNRRRKHEKNFHDQSIKI